MSNNKMLVDERQSDIGNFWVGRLLPFRKKRQVGPFTFIDHMGPAKMEPGKPMEVDQHPHVGLSTLTYLFDGAVHHRDSMGSDVIVNPGDVAFMTSGKGVTHTERTPQELRDTVHTMHGYQIWVALPKELEEMEPQFDFYAADSIPEWEENNMTIKLVAGEGFGKKAPLQGFSPLFMVDILAHEDAQLDIKSQLKGEIAFVVVKGAVRDGDDTIDAGQMLISKTEDECKVELKKGTQLLLFGGKPLGQEHYLLWNFVSSSKERLQQAKSDWEQKLFPKVPGDETYIPFPKPRI
ncbi:MAG: pirin family protein [bacterium]|nr:pirin family protein [bacterium]